MVALDATLEELRAQGCRHGALGEWDLVLSIWQVSLCQGHLRWRPAPASTRS
jgi:hypothetical protein